MQTLNPLIPWMDIPLAGLEFFHQGSAWTETFGFGIQLLAAANISDLAGQFRSLL